jgi:hypothetical protein
MGVTTLVSKVTYLVHQGPGDVFASAAPQFMVKSAANESIALDCGPVGGTSSALAVLKSECRCGAD